MSEQENFVAEATEIVADAVPEQPVGERLREAREARGMTVGDIAQTLKLGSRQVEALEAGRWEVLPGPTFIRGFVRNYARLVQLDPVPMMAILDRVLEKPVARLDVPESRPATMPSSGRGLSRRDRNVVLFGAGLVVLAAGVYFLMPNDLSALREDIQSLVNSLSRKDQPAGESAQTNAAPEPVFPPGTTPQQVMNPQAMVPAENVPPPVAPPVSEPVAPAAPVNGAAQPATPPAPPASAPPPATPSASAATAPQLRFVFDKDSWLEVRDRNNKVVFSQRLTAGAEQSLTGNGPLSVVVGYAPGAHLYWRGQPVDLAPHTKGDVARLVLE